MTVTELCENLDSRRYPDVARCALGNLFKMGPQWGVGPQHETLRSLGLADILPGNPVTGVREIRMTALGRAVAMRLFGGES